MALSSLNLPEVSLSKSLMRRGRNSNYHSTKSSTFGRSWTAMKASDSRRAYSHSASSTWRWRTGLRTRLLRSLKVSTSYQIAPQVSCRQERHSSGTLSTPTHPTKRTRRFPSRPTSTWWRWWLDWTTQEMRQEAYSLASMLESRIGRANQKPHLACGEYTKNILPKYDARRTKEYNTKDKGTRCKAQNITNAIEMPCSIILSSFHKR